MSAHAADVARLQESLLVRARTMRFYADVLLLVIGVVLTGGLLLLFFAEDVVRTFNIRTPAIRGGLMYLGWAFGAVAMLVVFRYLAPGVTDRMLNSGTSDRNRPR